MSTDNALDALTARMLEAVKNTRESADSAAASAQQAQKMAEGEMQGTSLTGAEKKRCRYCSGQRTRTARCSPRWMS